MCADCMISQECNSWCARPDTSHSQISHPHAGSPWTFFLFTHPLPHSLSHTLSASEHTTSVSLRRCSPRLLRKTSFPRLSFFFWAIFSPSFVTCDDPRSADLLVYESGSCGEKASTLRVRWTSFVKFQILWTINYWSAKPLINNWLIRGLAYQ